MGNRYRGGWCNDTQAMHETQRHLRLIREKRQEDSGIEVSNIKRKNKEPKGPTKKIQRF